MKKLALVPAWLAVIFCFLCLPAYGFQVCNIFFALAGVLFVPDGVLSRALGKYLKIKPAFIYLSATVFLLVGVLSSPGLVFGRENAPAQTENTAFTTAATSQTTLQTSITSAQGPNVNNTTVHTTAAPPNTAQPATSATTPVAAKYLLNKSSKKIHYPTCRYADGMMESNRAEYNGDYTELLSQGYTTCGICFKK
ncbi:MAG: hypothetical protein IJX27_02150 [Clostridia bacterium]|nr:hypothetical protein [Clostridia bacterium]